MSSGKFKTLNSLYLQKMEGENKEIASDKFKILRKYISKLNRSKEGSNNSLLLITQSALVIWNTYEYFRNSGFPDYDFNTERKVLNRKLLIYLDKQKASKYEGICCSYGETLLNLYMDIFLKFTVRTPSREINFRPMFMTNPDTGIPLELDIYLEGFKLALEFQGDFHYTNIRQMKRDAIKFDKCDDKNIILIPINIADLNQNTLATRITNIAKDNLGLHHRLLNKRFPCSATNSSIRRFCYLAHRIYAAQWLYGSVLKWLDEESRQYNIKMVLNNSRSAVYSAPDTLINPILSVTQIYSNTKNLW